MQNVAKCEYIHGSENEQSNLPPDAQYPDYRTISRESAISHDSFMNGF